MQQIQHRELLRVAQTIFFVLLWSLTIVVSAQAQNPKHMDHVVPLSPASPNQAGLFSIPGGCAAPDGNSHG